MSARTLVSAAELRALQVAGDALVVDCRFDLAHPQAGAREHAAAHIPGAVYAHLDDDLSGPRQPALGRHPLPQAAAFASALSRWGWSPGRQVVAYDDAGGALAAARLWWLLRLAGAERAAVLDGGLAAWRRAGLPLEAGTVAREGADVPSTAVTIAFDAASRVVADELERRLADASIVLVDARAAARFRGEIEPIDAKAGHVPGARNRPFSDNLQADGTFKPAEQLRREWLALLPFERRATDVVHMCGSGVTACHNLLAMEHAGLAGARVYAPSWSGWIDDAAHAVATVS